MRLFLSLLLLSVFFDYGHTASCGGSGIPFRFEVLPTGTVVLGCASPACFGGSRGGRDILHDSSFEPTADGEDGFFREGDLNRVRSRYGDAPAQQAVCPESFDSSSCANQLSWVGGIQSVSDGSLLLQCCRYDGLRFAAEVGRPIVHPGEVYSGGEVLRDGRQTGFDLISNVKKIEAEDGTTAYELVVKRMNCLPDPPPLNDVTLDVNDIPKILDKVAPAQETGAAPVPEQPLQVIGEQVVPVESSGYYYPVASGVPACFTGDMTVETPEGTKSMRNLAVGDWVLTLSDSGDAPLFTQVYAFTHRLPEQKASFVLVETEANKKVKLTPRHFIFLVNCNATSYNHNLVYAEDLVEGDCLYTLNHYHELVTTRVRRLSVVEEEGAYAPLTSSGDLLVNGVYTSCHSIYRQSTLSQSLLELTRNVESTFMRLFGAEDETELPTGVRFLLSIADHVMPHAMSL